MNEKNQNHVATVTFLEREQVDYLDKLGKDYFFKYGHKLARGRILSELVWFLMNSEIDLSKMNLENETFSEALQKVIRNEKQKVA